MPGWEQIALAAMGSGGGGGGVTLDVNELINPIGSYLYDVFTESSQIEMPAVASAYPSVWSEQTFYDILNADNVQVGWADPLEWHMAQDSWWPDDQMDWTLLVSYQWVYLPEPDTDELVCPSGGLYLIHNARASVDLTETGWGWKLYVQAEFDRPYPDGGGVTAVPVTFHVKVTDGDGDVERDTTRRFAIKGDGTHEVIQGA
jgi:hypothetical protein